MEDLDYLLSQIRRIEAHRESGVEKQIQATYQKLLKELRYYLADEYSQYAEDDKLTYDILQKNGSYARFLEEVEQKINGVSPETRRLIRSTVEQTYEVTYNGMMDCVSRAATGVELGVLKACTPDILKRAVENPISKLTLNDRLEKHRKDIVYDIKQNISVGLMNGDRYSTMAKRIKDSVDGDYKKAIRIARTETHRVREAGNHDAAQSVNESLRAGSSGMQMMKTWKTMKDERVRPAGKVKGKSRQYDHRKMNDIAILVDDEFTLPSGAKTMAPGQSGVAGEDIHCRCYLSYGLQRVIESDTIEEEKIRRGNLRDSFGKEHTDQLMQKLEEAPEPLKKVWNKYADNLKVTEVHTENGAYYSPADGGIHVNIEHDSKKNYISWLTDAKGNPQYEHIPYDTEFHEFGHNIAHLAAKEKHMGYDYSAVFRSKRFTRSVIARDGSSEVIGLTLSEKIQNEAVSYVKKQNDCMKLEATKKGLKKSSILINDVRQNLSKEIGEIPLHAQVVSDIWEGATEGKIRGYVGHGKAYWNNHVVGQEAFAEMFSASINNLEALEQIQKYFPESYELFLEMLDSLL